MYARALSAQLNLSEHAVEPYIRRVLWVLIVVLAFFYAYSICASVIDIVARKDAEATISTKTSTVADLETQYFALINGVTREHALASGLTPITDTQYVERAMHTARANISANEI